MLSFDWLLDTDETLELRTKPKVARRAAGRAEKPGGRRPDWPGLSRRLLGVVSGPLSPDLFCSPGDGLENIRYYRSSGQFSKNDCNVTGKGREYTGNVLRPAGKTDRTAALRRHT